MRPDLGLNSYSQVLSSGFSHAGVISGNGSLYMWGSNDHGELGDGTYEWRGIHGEPSRNRDGKT